MTPFSYKLENVQFDYNSDGIKFSALVNVNLDIKTGSYVAILGPSGSGKSTLLNLLGLLAKPSTGSLSIQGTQTAELDEDQLATLRNQNIGFVFQHFALLPRLSVLENICLPMEFADSKVTKEKALVLLDQLGMTGFGDRFPSELSGGQKQRVAICRALVMNPGIILADEPTGALDTKTTSEVMTLLEQLNSQGITVIVITHNLDVAKRARTIVNVKDGTVSCEAEAAQTTSINTERQSPSPLAPMPSNDSVQNANAHGRTGKGNALFSQLSRALRSLLANRMRSSLTALGLVIGVISIVVIAGLGELVQSGFSNLFYTPGAKKIYVFANRDQQSKPWQGLGIVTEVPKLAERFAKYGQIRANYSTSESCRIGSDSQFTKTRITAVMDAAEFKEMDTAVTAGRLPTVIEMDQSVTVLGSDMIDLVFSATDPNRLLPNFPIGQKLTVTGCEFSRTLSIVGVLAPRDANPMGRDNNQTLYVPMNAILQALPNNQTTFLNAIPKEGVEPRWLADSIAAALSLQYPGVTFESRVPSEIIEKVRSFISILQGLTGAIGFLCVVVSGIGIMNIMLVTVTERTREIGIQKSLGAKPHHIRNQFLIESVTLCLLACAVGIGVSFVINNLLALAGSILLPKFGAFKIIFSIWGVAIAVVVSFASGIIFGIAPALRASRKDAAECLREE